jgi:hypothetical protein
MRPHARAALLMMLPRGPVDVKGRPGRVITLRGGLGHARVSILKSNSDNRGHPIRLWRANKGSLARPAYLIRGLDDLHLDGRRCSGLGPRRPCPGACSYIGFYSRCLDITQHGSTTTRAPTKKSPAGRWCGTCGRLSDAGRDLSAAPRLRQGTCWTGAGWPNKFLVFLKFQTFVPH